ncbi:hypothetical protein Ae168Ps1_6080c [Pseudonocardia sp. Ae168_Ps1]|nr:hypothetical protein Ae150APs1_6022c [Pseudonocardia sp. Ae150A_Ps1]OLL70615.1 hypothetical protein Ae168Ps1_6080c [Pseudonocardia sp. Ae168_Ps1]OLL70764.1 hypothetical protein Ae263Ps1_6178c [Pseudonocardia sp. Ae263_Ps1]OLL89326.1 hypothetical protein Ae356Ps1_6070c [Pseudonocardia sp. Ae356_Ps1]
MAGPVVLGDTPARRGDLAGFRQEFYDSLTARADALFELCDAVLCAAGPVHSRVELTPRREPVVHAEPFPS